MPASDFDFTGLDAEGIAQKLARVVNPSGEVMAAVGAAAAAAGTTFRWVNERSFVIREELSAGDMAPAPGEVLLGKSRETVFASASMALAMSNSIFAQGFGDSRKIVTVLTIKQVVQMRASGEITPTALEAALRKDEGAIMVPGNFHADILQSANSVMLAMLVNKVADVKKPVQKERDGRTVMELVPCDFPIKLAGDLMASDVLTALPQLRGVSHVPVMRPNGDLVSTSGYDALSQMWLSTAMPEISVDDLPSRQDAEAALKKLSWLLRTYEFAGEVNRIAAVAGLMTSVLRSSMSVAPLIISTAGQARTGKDHLLRTYALASVGIIPTLFGIGKTEEEQSKRLSQIFHTSSPFVVLSNINGGLNNDDLCVFISEGFTIVRAYGTYGTAKQADYAQTWAATGNNLEPRGDLVPRCLVIRQQSESPNPGEREFTWSPHEWLDNRDNRREILEAVFTIARWWLLSGRHTSGPGGGAFKLGGSNNFNEWSRLVREPLKVLTGEDVFQATFDADETARATDGPGAFNDACGMVLDGAWRLQYPWSVADARRRLDQWNARNAEDFSAQMPEHISFCHTICEDYSEATDEELEALVRARRPRDWVGVSSIVVKAYGTARSAASDMRDEIEHGENLTRNASVWLEEMDEALPRVETTCVSAQKFAHATKPSRGVAGAMWRLEEARDQQGRPMKGGANGAKPMWRWSRVARLA